MPCKAWGPAMRPSFLLGQSVICTGLSSAARFRYAGLGGEPSDKEGLASLLTVSSPGSEGFQGTEQFDSEPGWYVTRVMREATGGLFTRYQKKKGTKQKRKCPGPAPRDDTPGRERKNPTDETGWRRDAGPPLSPHPADKPPMSLGPRPRLHIQASLHERELPDWGEGFLSKQHTSLRNDWASSFFFFVCFRWLTRSRSSLPLSRILPVGARCRVCTGTCSQAGHALPARVPTAGKSGFAPAQRLEKRATELPN